MTNLTESLTSEQAAEYLAVREGSLRSMRSCGYGPPFHREGRSVRYLLGELDKYIAELDSAATVRRNNRLLQKQERGTLAD